MTEYRGRVWIDHWHDGDTFYGIIDPGWGVYLGADMGTAPVSSKLVRVRIAGIDAPEITASTPPEEFHRGMLALAYAGQIAPEKHFYDYVGHNRDKYGRPLLDLFLPKSRAGVLKFSQDMLANGHAVVMK